LAAMVHGEIRAGGIRKCGHVNAWRRMVQKSRYAGGVDLPPKTPFFLFSCLCSARFQKSYR
jgi:hypothetical protein